MMSDSHSQHRPVILNLTSSRTYSSKECFLSPDHDSKSRGSAQGTLFQDISRTVTNSPSNTTLLQPTKSNECSYTNDTPSPKQKKELSDAGSKSRKFSVSWKHTFPFLEHDQEQNLMFCKVCRRFSGPTQRNMPFVAGTSNFRSSSITYHESSVLHWKCRRLEEEEEDNSSGGQLLDEDKKKLAEVIRTVYFMVKTRSPFSDFPQLCRAQMDLGLHLGQAYTSHQSIVPIFAKYIANSLEKDISRQLEGVGEFSLIVDSSLTRVSENHQLVYIKYFREGSLKTDFLGVVDASGSSDCVFQNVNNLFNKFGFVLWTQKVVYVFVDAWSNFPSWYEGFVEILRNKSSNSFVWDINFVSHKLKCCSRLFSENMLMDSFNSLIYDIFCYYKNLPEDMRSLVYMNKELDSILLTYGNLPKKALACFSFETFEALDRNWVPLVLLLKKYTDSNLDAKARSVGIKILQSVRKSTFLWTLALVLDISNCLADFSNKIGESDFMPFSLLPETKETHRKMQEAVAGKGQYVCRFQKDMCSKSLTFRKVGIRMDANLAEVVAQVQYPGNLMVEQVSRISEKLSWLKDSLFLDTRQWPQDHDSLAHFGDSEFSNLHLKCSGTDANLTTAISEWRTLKTNVLLCFPPDVLDSPRVAVSNMIDVFRQELSIATSLLERLLLLDLSSSELADGFREMSLVKSSERSRLSVGSLQSLMTIVMRGPEVSGFDPVPVMRDWMEGRARRYHKRKGSS